VCEFPESFSVSLSWATNATVTDPSVGSCVIYDDETPPLVTIQGGGSVQEAEGAQLTFTVSITNTCEYSLTFDWQAVDGTTEGSLDYTPTSGQAVIPAGDTTATFAIGVLNDGVYEGNEDFSVSL